MAGPLIPLSQTLLLASYPPAMAGTAIALWGMTTLVAPVIGPLLGGWITDNFNWPWIFYINVPVGLLCALFTWSIYRSRDPGPRKVPVDALGLLLLVVWIGAFQIMIDKGKELDWFESGEIIALTVVSVVSFLFFLAWELTDQHPIVELRLFARRNFLTGTLSLSVAYGLFFGNVVLLPLWLQQFMGYTATEAGMVMAPVGLLAIVFSPFVGKTVGKVDAVFKSGNATRDDIPSHLVVGPSVTGEVAELYEHMCPAGVYERRGDGLAVNPPNCVDCKATDVIGPRWTPREGGSGPRYRRM